MMVRDLNLLVKDDYSNISTLFNKNCITFELSEALKEANGLRNRLIHRYNKEDIVFESIKKLLPSFNEFLEEVKKWLKEKLKK